MTQLFSWIFNRTVLILLGLIIVACLIYYGGPLIGFTVGTAKWVPLESFTARMVLIGLIFAIWIGIRLFDWWRERSRNAALIKELSKDEHPPAPGVVVHRQRRPVHFRDHVATVDLADGKHLRRQDDRAGQDAIGHREDDLAALDAGDRTHPRVAECRDSFHAIELCDEVRIGEQVQVDRLRRRADGAETAGRDAALREQREIDGHLAAANHRRIADRDTGARRRGRIALVRKERAILRPRGHRGQQAEGDERDAESETQ